MNTPNRSTRLAVIALGVFGFAATLTATAGVGNCSHCLDGYYACRASSPDPDPQPCLNALWDCQRSNGCQISDPPEI